MKRIMLIAVAVSVLGNGVIAFAEKPATKVNGEAEFKEHCALCHPDGGNIINPMKTLHSKDLRAGKIKTEADIIKITRKPGPGMTAFDAKTLPNDEAGAIAKYILKTFK